MPVPSGVAAAVNASFLADLLTAIVQIPSMNPTLLPGEAGEAEVARYLAAACGKLGMRVSVEEPLPGRPNVIAVLPGAGPARGRRLMLNGHMDTVGVAGMAAPFAAEQRNGRLYGRGAYDMKGGLAAMVGAVAAVRGAGLTPLGDVLLTFVADEEYLSAGTAAVASTLRADAAIVTEPTSLRICIAHKGFLWATIRTEGRAAHGSDYETGVDAITHMGRVLGALEQLDRDVLSRRTHPLLGRASLHASVIRGGEGLSTYPPSSELSIERRTLPDETEGEVRAQLKDVLASLHRDDPRFRASLEVTGARPGLEVSPETPVVGALARAMTGLGVAADPHIGAGFWCDAALLAAAGIPSVVFGPSGAGAHAQEEYVDLTSVVTCARVLAAVIVEFCGAEGGPAGRPQAARPRPGGTGR